ncbi:MAG TPA: zinc metallopeptidase, partial [Candidatus Latescibacteria bacterium]|nr:zinc metallopeptidase [Candidatus Latescibacterota bacterium]
AHEVGHALQHAHGYQPVTWRSRLVPVANIGSTAAFPLFFIGLLFGKGLGLFFMDLGIALFLFALLFHIVTLPVEFNASKRALAILEDSGMLAADEIPGAKAVLRAAALTYVASATMALMNLLRLIILRNAMSRD